MEKKNEVILQNTVVGNVVRYLLDRLGTLTGHVIERTGPDGTIYADCIQNAFPAIFDMSSAFNKIEIKYTTTITPQGNVEKAYGLWDNFIAMSFEAQQLQTDTVQVKGQCDHAPALSIFDDCWAAMLKAFGAAQPSNVIADNLGGTVTYNRNAQGQTVISGGTINAGYTAELGKAVAIRPEGTPFEYRDGANPLAPAFDVTSAEEAMPSAAGGADAPKQGGKPKQKGRYRLTQAEIHRRRKKVKEVEKIKRDFPEKTWKQIASEQDIPERTLRAWRHNNY